MLKAGKINPVFMHCDSVSVPPPLPPWGISCNATWILTDYTRENGGLFMAPGSHRLCRHPTAAEQPRAIGGPGDDDILTPVEAKAGSLCVFHGNTWHGAFGKDNDTTRVSLATIYCRTFVMPAEDFGDITDEMIAPHGDRFAKLVWRDKWQGYREEGPAVEKLASFVARLDREPLRLTEFPTPRPHPRGGGRPAGSRCVRGRESRRWRGPGPRR